MSERKNFGAKPLLFPQPVLIIGTYDENGKANAMNAAWGGIVGADEIIIDLSRHKTTENIMLNRAFIMFVWLFILHQVVLLNIAMKLE